MREELDTLVQLQNLDLDIRRLETEKARGPERLNALNERLLAVEAELTGLNEKIGDFHRRCREVEEELEAETARLAKSQGKLMAVKTNREYQAMLKEIEEIKKANKTREQEIEAAVAEAESLGAGVPAKEEDVARTRAEVDAEQAHLNKSISELDKKIAKLTRDRNKVAKKVSQALLSRYQFLRDRRQGTAVVAVSEAVCSGCHMNVPPQLFNELLRDERIFTCPSCQRFIYAVENE